MKLELNVSGARWYGRFALHSRMGQMEYGVGDTGDQN